MESSYEYSRRYSRCKFVMLDTADTKKYVNYIHTLTKEYYGGQIPPAHERLHPQIQHGLQDGPQTLWEAACSVE